MNGQGKLRQEAEGHENGYCFGQKDELPNIVHVSLRSGIAFQFWKGQTVTREALCHPW